VLEARGVANFGSLCREKTGWRLSFCRSFCGLLKWWRLFRIHSFKLKFILPRYWPPHHCQNPPVHHWLFANSVNADTHGNNATDVCDLFVFVHSTDKIQLGTCEASRFE